MQQFQGFISIVAWTCVSALAQAASSYPAVTPDAGQTCSTKLEICEANLEVIY